MKDRCISIIGPCEISHTFIWYFIRHFCLGKIFLDLFGKLRSVLCLYDLPGHTEECFSRCLCHISCGISYFEFLRQYRRCKYQFFLFNSNHRQFSFIKPCIILITTELYCNPIFTGIFRPLPVCFFCRKFIVFFCLVTIISLMINNSVC